MLTIFADEVANSGVSTGWAVACLATTGTAIAALFTYLGARDKLRYDVRLSAAEAEVIALRKSHVECEKAQKELRDLYTSADGRADIAEKRSAVLEGQMKGMEWQLSTLQAEVKELRDRLHERL